ncbi:MAG: trypsin-like peptidase domain-containing protein [Isosphaeraceae bacterium]
MSYDETRSIPHGRRGRGRRPVVLTMTAVAALLLLLVSGRISPAQEEKARAGQEAKLGLGDLIKEANPCVVLINIENKSGQKIGFGSGFLVDNNQFVVTNLHVIKRAAKAHAVFDLKEGNTAVVKSLRAYDKKRDLAILELDRTPAGVKSLPLGPRTVPALGDTVTAIGHPQGLNFTATNGIVGGIRRASDTGPIKAEDDRVMIQSTAFIGGGSSGGPLLSDAGRVIGINTSVLPGQGISFAVHVSHLIDLLPRARAGAAQPLPGNEGSELFSPLADLEPRVRGMYEEYSNAANEYNKQLQGARNQIEYGLISRTQNPGPKYAKRFFQIASQEPRSISAFQALFLAVASDDPAAPGSVFKPALDRMLQDYAKERWFHHVFQSLNGLEHESVTDLLRETLKRNSHRAVQGAACYYLASRLQQKPKYDEAEVLGLLKRCTVEFKEVPLEFDLEGQRVEYSLADLAKPLTFAIEHLSVGKKALDIVGTDADGKTFKLSDYKGKVVVLDFFADWCPYCVKMYPEERTLVQKLEGKPFAILGVNCDSIDTLRQILADKRITWRCWSDGKEGPISQTWQLEGYPLTFVLDHEGVIRHKFEGFIAPGVLAESVDKLMKAIPAQTTKTKANGGK